MGCHQSPPRVARILALCLLARFSGVSGRRLGDGDVIPGTIHTVISTECTPYFSFQTLALGYSHRVAGQPGPVTRIMSCEPDKLAVFSPEDMSIMDTHVAPSFSHNPKNGDDYAAYNKPSGVMHWLDNVKPKEEWILIMDADTIFRRQILPEDLKEGWIASAHYGYMIGCCNALAERHIPEVPKRTDSYGGKPGRRADEAGAFYLVRRKDLQALAPLWQKYTEDVRDDKNAWNLTGDAYVKPGQKAWISEMYGWIFGAAKAGLKHKIDTTAQVYPDGEHKDAPKVIHYGLEHKVMGYRFDKHEHMGFDFTQCPPWDLSMNRSRDADAGLFPHPPHPSEVPTQGYSNSKRYGILLNIEFMNTINLALCERHRKKCPDSAELKEECGKVDAIAEALRLVYSEYDKDICEDEDPKKCEMWKEKGECEANWLGLQFFCRRTCGNCYAVPPGRKSPMNVANVASVRNVAGRGLELGRNGLGKESDPPYHKGGNITAVQEDQGNGNLIALPESKISNNENNNNNQEMHLSNSEFKLRVRCHRIESSDSTEEALECSKLVLVADTPLVRASFLEGVDRHWFKIEFVFLVVALTALFICAQRRPWRNQRRARSSSPLVSTSNEGKVL